MRQTDCCWALLDHSEGGLSDLVQLAWAVPEHEPENGACAWVQIDDIWKVVGEDIVAVLDDMLSIVHAVGGWIGVGGRRHDDQDCQCVSSAGGMVIIGQDMPFIALGKGAAALTKIQICVVRP